MRRGHPGAGGWRGDNPRHFRPRGGGTPHFRHPRGYGPPESLRFPPPGRGHLSHSPYQRHPGPPGDHTPDHERKTYRGQRHDRGSNYGRRQIFPMFQRMRHSDIDGPYYDNNQNPQIHTNSMGDVDHRQPLLPLPPHSQDPMIPWDAPNCGGPPNFDERRNTNKPYRTYGAEANKPVTSDYPGHRPPSSDHYGGSSGSVLENSNAFSCSVDDTVDIVRKRLMNRDSQQPDNISGEQTDSQTQSDHNQMTFENSNQEQPKKRIQRTRQNVKSDCDKIKNKIVHQLFVMDKEKIHKLMDNPSSSSKFEFAISSLVTESQNSYNRHMRSLAEKSLGSSSAEFVHNDKNTIYEDTFMRQMQCLLDPQDTVLLEDLKPLVLAELSKVLQLSEFDQFPDDQHFSQDDQSSIDQYPSHSYNYEDYSELETNENRDFYIGTSYERAEDKYLEDMNRDYGSQATEVETKPLFERRHERKSCDSRQNTEYEKRSERKSVDSRHVDENPKRSGTPLPCFDPNVDALSEDDDDPFAELDNQYHVAVDHNFISTDEPTFPRIQSPPRTPKVKREPSFSSHQTEITCSRNFELRLQDFSKKIVTETDSELHDFSKSPLKFSSKFDKPLEGSPSKSLELDIKKDLIEEANKKDVSNDEFEYPSSKDQNTQSRSSRLVEDKSDKSDLSQKSSKDSNSRKRSTDQRPSHRKEKRKKSDSSQLESNKQILNKNIIINVNDCAAKSLEKCEPSKSIFNLFFAKDKNKEESKKNESSDKCYSEKYVKRKEKDTVKKSREKEIDKKRRDSTTSHSILSPTDASNILSQTPIKTESIPKLKTIDIFEAPHKKSNVHQAHRNTAIPNTPNKSPSVEVKCKPPPLVTGRKVTRRHIATQVTRKSNAKETQTMESRCSSSRFTQTEKKKLISRGAQTVPVIVQRDKSRVTDPLERMKEIDLEIQTLLQEKFKLYSSIEAKESCSSTMKSLGMAVLNMTPDETQESETDLDEDIIVEDFANIPVEELEELAFGSVEQEPLITEKKSKKIKKEKKHSHGSEATSARSKRSSKHPNISLIEQIITDERPLEDIISLDDLELPPIRSKKKSKKSPPKKKVTKKSKNGKAKVEIDNSGIVKECSVVLLRENLDKYLNPKVHMSQIEECVEVLSDVGNEVIESVLEERNIVEETIVNVSDIHFDMLDVSEDIVIGDMCEVKTGEECNSADMGNMSVCEEIILDNSQSGVNNVLATECVTNENKCRTYDFAADENLRRDSTVVSGIGDAILAIECIENNFIAASLDGNVYYYNGDGQLLNTLRGSNLAVTCLTIVREKYGTTVYTGSLDSRIRYYDLDTGLEKGPECNVLSPIQTMDRAWDTIFVGTRTGFVLQFECKNNMLIPVSTVKFSEQSILALKALKEGPRKVLLVGARSESVTVKDAQTGLLLRTLEGPKMSVYSLLFEDGKVYCGTSSSQIHVFDYASGSHVGTHEGGKGCVCLRAVGGVVFAGCYDGCVYVYSEDTRPVAQLRGPGLMLLSLAVHGSKIIAGYKDRSVYIWKIPLPILQEMIL